VPFELVPIDFFKKEHKSPEYLEKQPFGQVPYIDDDGFIPYESRAICYYIAAKYPNQGTTLHPTELKANALFPQAASIEICYFSDNVLKALEEMILKPSRLFCTAPADIVVCNLTKKHLRSTSLPWLSS